MPAARRLYVYLISGIGLALWVTGLQSLVRIALDAVGLGSTVVVIGEGSSTEQLSGALALVAVGAPVWLLHWGWLERSLRTGRPAVEGEQASGLRALYLTVVLAVLLVQGSLAGSSLVAMGMTLLGGGEMRDLPPGAVAGTLATLVVVPMAWIYHAGIRRRDLAVGPVAGAAAWLPRAYLYGAAFGGILALTGGLTELVGMAVDAVFGGRTVLLAGDGGVPGLAGPVGTTVIASAVWLGHYGYAERVMRRPGWRGRAERPSLLRLGFLVLALSVTVQGALTELAEVGAAGLGAAMDTLPPGSSLVALLVGQTVLAVLFGIGAAAHVQWMREDAQAIADPGRPAAVWRLERYVLALTGLAFAAGGVVALISIIVRSAAGTELIGGETNPLAGELAQTVPFVAVGTLVWVMAWAQVIRRTEADPVAEAADPIRRVALLGVLAISVVSGLIGLAIVLYNLFVSLLDGHLGGAALAQLGMPLGLLVVGLVIGAYHGALLRRDVSLVPRAPAAEAPAVVDLPLAPPPPAEQSVGVPAVPHEVTLTLRGPDDADLEAALESARAALPEGYRLERD